MLWMLYLIHDPAATPAAIIADVDAEIARLQSEPPSQAELERALTKLRASLYDLAGSSTRFGLLDLLASFALFDDDPGLHQSSRVQLPRGATAADQRCRANLPDSGAQHHAGRRAGPRAGARSGSRSVKRVAALLACLAALNAAAADRELPPAPGTPHEFKLPAKETLRLDNGLAMTFIDYGSVPKVTLFAVVRTGNIDEGKDTWLPDVAVEMLKEGTTTRSAAEHAEAAAGMGGTLALGVGAEQTTASISVLSEHAVGATELLADVLRNPRFPESELPRVLANFERSLAVARSDPQSLADEALAKLVFGDHPLRPSAAEGRPARRLRHREAARLLRPELRRAPHARLRRRALRPRPRSRRRSARPSATGARARRPPSCQSSASEKLQLALVDSPGAPQSSVRIAVPVPDPSHALYFPTTLMNSLLGGTFGSRITTQHPRGQGLQLFAGLVDQRAPRRRAVDHERGNNRRAHGRRARRDIPRD